ncbi:MAG: YggS family pyridoxal phosphate-dependent enzyme [Bacteroidetes bacterium]|nr:MAG: YggS family pyridoxal phosphate-dependent enzyme [Bacteroidota bacterium]
MSVYDTIKKLKSEIPLHVKLVVVTKTHPAEKILNAYNTGHKIFGENRVQELIIKYEQLPKDIEWHLIGHLQTNKVKQIAPFVSLIHSVDSLKLLKEINKCAEKEKRVIDCLLQIYVAKEETKFGLSFEEAEGLLASEEFKQMKNICVVGLMGMATLTDNETQIKNEFRSLKTFYDKLQTTSSKLLTLSMGMSSDYKIAIEEGSNLIRIGSLVFGERH